MSKGQTIVDYLLTYGWVLLLIAIFIGLILYNFGGSWSIGDCYQIGTQIFKVTNVSTIPANSLKVVCP